MSATIIFLLCFFFVLSVGASYGVVRILLNSERERLKRERRSDRKLIIKHTKAITDLFEKKNNENLSGVKKFKIELEEFVGGQLLNYRESASKELKSTREYAEAQAKRREDEYNKVAEVVFNNLSGGGNEKHKPKGGGLNEKRLRQQQRIVEEEKKNPTPIVGQQ